MPMTRTPPLYSLTRIRRVVALLAAAVALIVPPGVEPGGDTLRLVWGLTA